MKKILFISLAVVLALSVSLIGCGDGDGGVAIPYKNDGMFIQQTIGEIDSLDYAWSYDTASNEQIQYLYETLLWYDEDNTSAFIPMLATEWTVVNATQIKFKIRSGVTFHNGNNLTPEDVEYSFERNMVYDRSGGPTWMINLPLLGTFRTRDGAGVIKVGIGDAIADAVVVDGDWVVFNFAITWPMEQWKQILSQPWGSIVDKEWCVASGEEWDPSVDPLSGVGWHAYNNPDKEDSYLYDHVNGTGRWKLNLWDPANEIKLEKFTGYWGTAAPFDWVITKWVDEWTSRKLALLNGDADHVYVPRQYIGELEGIADLTVYKDLGELALTAMFFNYNIDPDSPYIFSGALDGAGIPPDFFTDLDVRKAFSYAFNYDTFFTDIWLGEAIVVGSPVIKGLLAYDPTHSKYSFCTTKVEEHLQLAWNGTVWGTGFQFTISYNTGNEQRRSACEILSEYFSNLGYDEFGDSTHFQIGVQAQTWPTFLDLIFTEDVGVHKGVLPIFVCGWGADYPDTDNFVTPFMHSEGDWSYATDSGTPALDAKIEAARYELVEATRITMYDEIADIFYADPSSILLGQPLGRRYFTKYITGFYFNPIIPGPAPIWDMAKAP